MQIPYGGDGDNDKRQVLYFPHPVVSLTLLPHSPPTPFSFQGGGRRQCEAWRTTFLLLMCVRKRL